MNSDLIRCPLTLQTLRHPILASDGRHYELRDLYKWLIKTDNQKISPFTRQPFTLVIYDCHLKQALDEMDIPERYKDYNTEKYLNTLLTAVNGTQRSQTPYPTKSIALFNGCLIVLLACNSMSFFLPSFLISTGVSLSDYTIRWSTSNRYSLFSLIEDTGRAIASPYCYAP